MLIKWFNFKLIIYLQAILARKAQSSQNPAELSRGLADRLLKLKMMTLVQF